MPEAGEVRIAVRAADFASATFKKIGSGLSSLGAGAVDLFRRGAAAATNFVKQIFSLGTAIKGIVVLLAARFIGNFITSVTDLGDQLDKMSQRVGVGVRFLSELRFAAAQSGATIQDLEIALRTAAIRLEEIRRTGRGQAQGALGLLGGDILLGAQRGEGIERILPRIADGFAAVADEEQRVAIATKLFGEAGTKLLPLFSQGSAGLERLRAQARELGLSLSPEGVAKSVAFTDALGRLKGALEGLKIEAVLEFAPALTAGFERLVQWITQNREAVINFLRDVAVGLLQVASALIDFSKGVVKIADTLSTWEKIKQTLSEVKALFPGGDLSVFESRNAFQFESAIENLDAFQQKIALAVERLRALKVEATAARGNRFGVVLPPAGSPEGMGPPDLGLVQQSQENLVAGFDRLRRIGVEASEQVISVFRRASVAVRGFFGQAKQEVIDLHAVVQETSKQIAFTFASQLSTAILAFTDRTRKAKDVALDFVKSFISAIAQLILQLTILAIVQKATGLQLLPVKGGAAKGGIFPPLRRAQAGGIFGHSLLEVGEAGNREAVVPLPDNRSIPVRFTNDAGASRRQPVVIENHFSFETKLLDAEAEASFFRRNRERFANYVGQRVIENINYRLAFAG